jgi:predicted DNA-binding ribbon-helix-helix protein
MRSLNVKRSIVLDGHKTSISLEDPFWSGLKTIAQARQTTLSELVTEIDGARKQSNLSSAIRLFVLNYFRKFYPAWIRMLGQNRRIMNSDVCGPLRTRNVGCRPVQVAQPA